MLVRPGCRIGLPPAVFGWHSGGWTLHRLRHSSLTYLAEAGGVCGDVAGEAPASGSWYFVGVCPACVGAVARFAADRFDDVGG